MHCGQGHRRVPVRVLQLLICFLLTSRCVSAVHQHGQCRIDQNPLHFHPSCSTAPNGASIYDVYVFPEPREAEIASRCCRSWVDEETLTASEVALGERILKAGLALFPADAMLAVHYANYLLDVMNTYNAGVAQMQVGGRGAGWWYLHAGIAMIRRAGPTICHLRAALATGC